MPEKLKLVFALWIWTSNKEHLRKEFRLGMQVQTVVEYLKRWGFMPHKHLKRDYAQNTEVVLART